MFAKKAVPLQRIVDCDTMAKEKTVYSERKILYSEGKNLI